MIQLKFLFLSFQVLLMPMSAQSQPSAWVESTLASMSLEEKVGQLLVADLIAVYAHKESPSVTLAESFVRDYHVGGFILAGGTVTDIALTTNRLQRLSKLPLIISGDLEGGLWFHHPYRWLQGRGPELPRFTGGGGTMLPSLMAVGATGDPHVAYEFGRITAREGRAVGIHWTNSPVADVNNNPNNPIINTRSFGEDPARVAAFVEAYVQGLQSERMIATLKHFPGHGDTEEDTHMKLPSLPYERTRLDSVEFVPFKAGIRAGAKAVMTAHIALTSVDTEKRPATLSPVLITDILRGQLGFKNLVVTDGMTMQGVTDHYTPAEAAVRSIEAGVDVVLVPADLDRAYRGILDAVRSGRITVARLDESVRRILAAKEWVGLDRQRLVDIDAITGRVGEPASDALADTMFASSVTLLRNEKKTIPFSTRATVHVVILSDEPDLHAGEALCDVLRPRTASVTLSRIWAESSAEAIEKTMARCREADVLVVGVFLSVGAWKGELGFSSSQEDLLRKVADAKKPTVTVTFGDPYVLGKLSPATAEIALYTGVRKAEIALGNALTGAADVHGTLPVTIPGRYKRGSGIHLPQMGQRGN